MRTRIADAAAQYRAEPPPLPRDDGPREPSALERALATYKKRALKAEARLRALEKKLSEPGKGEKTSKALKGLKPLKGSVASKSSKDSGTLKASKSAKSMAKGAAKKGGKKLKAAAPKSAKTGAKKVPKRSRKG